MPIANQILIGFVLLPWYDLFLLGVVAGAVVALLLIRL